MLVACVRRPGYPASAAQRIAKEEFDLGVQAPQVIIRPSLNGVEHGRIDPQEKRFSVRHGAY
jgi:hypothetical protein